MRVTGRETAGNPCGGTGLLGIWEDNPAWGSTLKQCCIFAYPER
jgi:hypothetical protein